MAHSPNTHHVYQGERKTQRVYPTTMTSISAVSPAPEAVNTPVSNVTAAKDKNISIDGKTSIIIISLTIHACTLCFLVSRAGLSYFLTTKADNGIRSLRGKLTVLHNKYSWIIPKMLTEQLLTWTLILMTVVDIAKGDMIMYPFVPKIARDLHLTGIVFCVNMGKYIYKTVHDMTLVEHLANFKVDILHHGVTLCCYAVFFTNKENLFLGLVGVLMESDLLCYEILKIHKLMFTNKNSPVYRRLVAVSTCITIMSRGILPLVFLITSVSYQPVMSMQFVSIIFWFLGLVFFLAISVWLIFRAVLRMRKTLVGHAHPVNINDFEETPPCGEQSSQDETSSGPVTPPLRPSGFPERVIPLQYKNDLSYLSPYSNVNINCNDRNSKLNPFNKKVTSKDTVNNIAVLFTPNPLRHVDKSYHRHREQRPTPGPSSRTITEIDESNRGSPTAEWAVETRIDESTDGVPRVAISSSERQSRRNNVTQPHASKPSTRDLSDVI